MDKKTLKEYRIWKGMKSRCYSPSQKARGRYQIIGINVCDRWKNSYEAFISDMGPIPGSDYSIDRINPLGDYEPDNCRWIPISEQSKNRTNCLMYTHAGRTECLKEWARIIGVKYTTIYKFIKRGCGTFEDAYERYSRKEEY